MLRKVLFMVVVFSLLLPGALATTDHGGSDWSPSCDSKISGNHINIGTFSIPSGCTVYVDASLKIQADKVDINGILNGNGRNGGCPGKPGQDIKLVAGIVKGSGEILVNGQNGASGRTCDFMSIFDGGDGGKGGTVNISASGSIDFNNIKANGGRGGDSEDEGGDGGRGGDVIIQGKNVNINNIWANGGRGGNSDGGYPGGDGGKGGTVNISASGSIDFNNIKANGGRRGYGTWYGTYVGGSGGDGGIVSISSENSIGSKSSIYVGGGEVNISYPVLNATPTIYAGGGNVLINTNYIPKQTLESGFKSSIHNADITLNYCKTFFGAFYKDVPRASYCSPVSDLTAEIKVKDTSRNSFYSKGDIFTLPTKDITFKIDATNEGGNDINNWELTTKVGKRLFNRLGSTDEVEIVKVGYIDDASYSTVNGGGCDLVKDPGSTIKPGENVVLKCYVPASYWGVEDPVDISSGEGLYFWPYEGGEFVESNNEQLRVYTYTSWKKWCRYKRYDGASGTFTEDKTRPVGLSDVGCGGNSFVYSVITGFSYAAYYYYGSSGYKLCSFKGEAVVGSCRKEYEAHEVVDPGETIETDSRCAQETCGERDPDDCYWCSYVEFCRGCAAEGDECTYRDEPGHGSFTKKFCPSGTVCAYGQGCCPPGKDMVCGGECKSTSAALCCDNTIITVGGSGSGDRNTWSGTLNGDTSKAKCTSAGSVGEHPPYLKAEIVTGSPARALRCTAINNNPYGRIPEIKMCGDNSCYDWDAYQYCDSGDVKAKTGAPCYPSNGIDCQGGGKCLGTSNHQARCCDPDVDLPSDTTNYYCDSSGQLKLGVGKWTYPWVEKCLLKPWNLNVFNKTGGKRFPAFGGKLVEIHVDIQNNRIDYGLLKDPYNITLQFPEFYNNTSGVMKRRSSWDNVISYTNSTGHNILGKDEKLPQIGDKKTYNLTVKVPTEFGVDELGEKIAVNISASGSFDSEVIEMNITCADKDGDGYLDEKCAPTQPDRDCNDTDPSANINISCVDIFTPQPKYISKSGRDLIVPVEIQNQWTNEVKDIEMSLYKISDFEGMSYEFENCRGSVNCQNTGSKRVVFDIGAAPGPDQVSTGTIDLVFHIPGNVPPKSYKSEIKIEEA